MWNIREFIYMSTQNEYSLATSLIETESRNISVNSQKIHGSDGKQWPLTPSPIRAPRPCCPPAIEMPPCLVPAGQLASCFRIPLRASCASLLPRRWVTTCCRLSLCPCNARLSCSLQSLLKLSLWSLGPSLLQFVIIVSLLLNHGNLIFEPVCVLLPLPAPLLPLLFW